jgi:UDP-GlcNAc:undecaprenyl-phosphate/decaprenyl-phosphate GlcNAc-1-phosphate transferase
VTTLAALGALPVAAGAIFLLLRSPLLPRLVKRASTGERWVAGSTPVGGGVGIWAGFVAGVLLAVAVGAVDATSELWGILAGATLLFLAGFVDDLRQLNPLTKLATQFAAAAIVVATGTHVQIVGNDVLATALAVVWLVGMTNAFNLLDNIDGLAASLAGIAAVYFAIDAVTLHPSHTALAFAVAIAAACAGFLPFNLRPGRPAAIYMGDAGSQLLGFALAALGLTSSWKVAGTTIATLLLPILILAVPILDTALVTVVRLLEGRPVTQGGRDHSSHRLVRFGLSEKHAVLLLGLVATALGAASLGYNVLDDQRITLPAILLTFVLLIQFASFLADIERRPTGGTGIGFRGAFDVHWRRLAEVVIDFMLICLAFLAAYYLKLGSLGTNYQRFLFGNALPVLIVARFVGFIAFGLYRSIWRYAAARDLAAVLVAVVLSDVVALALLHWTQYVPPGAFPSGIFVIDALLCTGLVATSRFAERGVLHWHARRRRADARRTLIVGAGRAGRSLHRELRETPGERVVGFLDDNPHLRRRRLQGVPVRGTLDGLARVLEQLRPDIVLVTIPNAPRERLSLVLDACDEAGTACRFVLRHTDVDPRAVMGAAAE